MLTLRSARAKDDAIAALEAFIEDHSGDDSLIERAQGDNGKYAKAEVERQIKDGGDTQEVAALKKLPELQEAETAAKSADKVKSEKLTQMVFAKIPTLTETEAKALAVCDKWLATIEARIGDEIERVTQTLANCVKELEERYAKPLPALEDAVTDYSAKVATCLVGYCCWISNETFIASTEFPTRRPEIGEASFESRPVASRT